MANGTNQNKKLVPVTDPDLLAQLEADTTRPVTDPVLLAQLEGRADQETPPSPFQRAQRELTQWRQPFREGYDLSTTGQNPLAGGFKFATGALGVPFAPIAAAAGGYRNLPPAIFGDTPIARGVGNALALPFDLVASIPAAVGGITKFGEQAMGSYMTQKYGLTPDIQNALVAALFGTSPEKIGESAEALSGLNQMAGAYTMPVVGAKAIGSSIPVVQEYASRRAARTEAKAGSLLNIGKNIKEARRGGAYIFQEGISGPGKTGYTKGKFGVTGVVSKGAAEARAKVNALNKSFNEKIIDPATKAGEVIDGSKLLESARKVYESAREGALLPDRAIARRMDWELKVLEERIKERGGKLTPREVQDFKVKNNALLKEIYEKRSRGTLTEKQAAREAVLLDNTAVMRRALEDLHPQGERINWSEGAGLQVAEAMERFYEQKLGRDPSLARGTGMNPAVAGKPRFIGLLALTELATYTPFRVAYNRFLNKIYRGIGGVPREFLRPPEIDPFTAPPDVTRPPNPNLGGGGGIPPVLSRPPVSPTGERPQIVKPMAETVKETGTTRIAEQSPLRKRYNELLAERLRGTGFENDPQSPVYRNASQDAFTKLKKETGRKDLNFFDLDKPPAETVGKPQERGYAVKGIDDKGERYEVTNLTREQAVRHAQELEGGIVTNIEVVPFDEFGKQMPSLKPAEVKPTGKWKGEIIERYPSGIAKTWQYPNGTITIEPSTSKAAGLGGIRYVARTGGEEYRGVSLQSAETWLKNKSQSRNR